MSGTFAYDRARMKELVQFMVGRGIAPAELGNALWLAEARNFVVHGYPIAGAVYRRNENGIEARGTKTLVAEVRRSGGAGESGGMALSLSAGERDSADWALRHLHDPDCASIWARAQPGEEIPLYALLALHLRGPSAEELAWAKRRIGEPAAQ